MTIPVPREVRQRLVDETLRKQRPALRWVVGVIAVVGMALAYGMEQARTPDSFQQLSLFKRLFQTGEPNRTYDATGVRSGLKRYVSEPRTVCRVHEGGDAYDYDCVATLTDQKGCTHYYPFYVMTSSIGLLSYSLDDAEASKVLRRFRLVDATPPCADQPPRDTVERRP